MGQDTLIEWAHHSVNFWWGCTKVSPACEKCYAETMAKLFSRGKATWGPNGARWIRHENARRDLYKLDKRAWKRGVRERVFINSMSDTFEDREDLNEAREMLWGACQFVSNLDILLLTKRPENVNRMVPKAWLTDWPAHVWIGTTVEDQARAEQRMPELVEIPAKVKFISYEPACGPLDMDYWFVDCLVPQIQWVICGCESGGKRRAMPVEWAESIAFQCAVAKVAFFMKQMDVAGNVSGDIAEFPEALRIREFPKAAV
jgi:protein gp37